MQFISPGKKKILKAIAYIYIYIYINIIVYLALVGQPV